MLVPMMHRLAKVVALTCCLASPCLALPSGEPEALGRVSFELIDNRIFVNVMINGEGPFHMILDTGASLTVRPEVARMLGLQAESTSEENGVGEKTVQMQSTHIRELRFGPVHLANLESGIISTADAPYVFGKVRVDGFLGLEVFEKYLVRHGAGGT
jgi:hypothetical protein